MKDIPLMRDPSIGKVHERPKILNPHASKARPANPNTIEARRQIKDSVSGLMPDPTIPRPQKRAKVSNPHVSKAKPANPNTKDWI